MIITTRPTKAVIEQNAKDAFRLFCRRFELNDMSFKSGEKLRMEVSWGQNDMAQITLRNKLTGHVCWVGQFKFDPVKQTVKAVMFVDYMTNLLDNKVHGIRYESIENLCYLQILSAALREI